NLLNNALKYTAKGKIELSLKQSSKHGIVEVKDSGIGISDEYLPKLYAPFSQEEQGYSRKFEGNGLGLSLVKQYCDLNNAQIEVESKRGEGSTFRIKFPSKQYSSAKC
ncbi:MAG: hybrid sensor histidine kinase/response regulator, partial [Melioribacteraceae bacterium]|nr:hybrid sensor histidine kinase/response regulator [Melioribacteraceae bacterium]